MGYRGTQACQEESEQAPAGSRSKTALQTGCPRAQQPCAHGSLCLETGGPVGYRWGAHPASRTMASWSSPRRGKPELVKPKDESAWHQYNSLIVHDVRRSAVRNLVNAGAFQGELLCGLQAAKRERCFAVTTLLNRRRNRSHGTSGNSRTARRATGTAR